MEPFALLLAALEPRAFTSLWFWLLLGLGWWRLSSRALGVPQGVLARARRTLRGADGVRAAAALTDLDAALWLGLRQALRWPLGFGERGRLWAVGLGSALLALLLVLGFRFRSELAQALFLLLAPQASGRVLSTAAARELAAAGVAGLPESAVGGSGEASQVTPEPEWICARLVALQGALRLIASIWLAVALLWGLGQVLQSRFAGF